MPGCIALQARDCGSFTPLHGRPSTDSKHHREQCPYSVDTCPVEGDNEELEAELHQ